MMSIAIYISKLNASISIAYPLPAYLMPILAWDIADVFKKKSAQLMRVSFNLVVN